MKTFRKTIALLLTVSLLVSLCVCGSGSAYADNGFPGQPPEGGPGAPPDGMGMPPDGMGTPPGGFGGGRPGQSAADIEYRGEVEITSADTQSGQTYTSTTSDESALLISTSEAVTVNDPTVTKTGDSDGGDSCNFYGLNAAVLVKDGTTATITGGTVTSDADGANGVFCYGGNGGRAESCRPEAHGRGQGRQRFHPRHGAHRRLLF